MKKPIIRVIVEPAPRRKGWLWRQVRRNGGTGAVSPKTYDSKALAKRAGQQQVDLLNGSLTHYGFSDASTAQLKADAPYAVLVVSDG